MGTETSTPLEGTAPLRKTQQQTASRTVDENEQEFDEQETKQPENSLDLQIKEYFGVNFPIKISKDVFNLRKEITQIRRFFHANPELSWQEEKTSRNISQYLEKLNIEIKTCAKTGIIGLLKGNHDGPCIMLRADMDALPIQETANVDFKSKKNGVMHACGHDAHMAILLGTARVLSHLRSYIHGSVKFVFQPAEEGAGGAATMVKEGVLENPHVDEVYGLHVWSYHKFGLTQLNYGALMAGCIMFKITIIGKGGHGAIPENTIDCVLIQSQLIQQLHSIVSRNISPNNAGVITIGKVIAGDRCNIIADKAVLEGTIRWFSKEIKDILFERIRNICSGIEVSYKCQVKLEFTSELHNPVISHKKCCNNIQNSIKQILPEKNILLNDTPTMASEDFSHFLKERPGCFFFLGCGVENENNITLPHHKSNFQVDERCLIIGTQIFTTLILDLLMAPITNTPIITNTNNRPITTENTTNNNQTKTKNENEILEKKQIESNKSNNKNSISTENSNNNINTNNNQTMGNGVTVNKTNEQQS